MQGQQGTGYIPSPTDFRDKYATTAVMLAQLTGVTLKSTLNIDLTNLGPVLMQAFEPACVSHSVALMLKKWWFDKTGEVVDFSPRFLDTLAKRYDGLGDPTNRATAGTYPRLVFKLAVQFGCATTKTVPNDTSLPVLQYRDDAILTAAAFAEAANYKIPGYIRIPDDPTSMRTAMQVLGPISLGMFVGQEWYTPSWLDSDIDPLKTPAQVISGHQVVGKGWVDNLLNILRNSWSDAWANKGEAKYDGQKWAPFIQEAWAIAVIPPDVADFLKTLPAPGDFHYVFNKNMKRGDDTLDVKYFQIAMMILGYLQPITPDEFGFWGPKTSGANYAFQAANKIAPISQDNAGPQTRAALNAEFAL